MREMNEKYAEFRHELKKFLFNEWYWFGIPEAEHANYDEDEIEIDELYHDEFMTIIKLLTHNATKEELEEYFVRQHSERRIGNLSIVNDIVKKMIAIQVDFQKYALLAMVI